MVLDMPSSAVSMTIEFGSYVTGVYAHAGPPTFIINPDKYEFSLSEASAIGKELALAIEYYVEHIDRGLAIDVFKNLSKEPAEDAQ